MTCSLSMARRKSAREESEAYHQRADILLLAEEIAFLTKSILIYLDS
jgi:hypothetical protein